MLSRRGVRIKVMQVLYALSRDETLSNKAAKTAYRDSVSRTYDLYQFAIYSLVKICKVSQEDELKKKDKYLPSEADKSFTSKLYDNPIIQSLANDKDLIAKAEKKEFKVFANIDFARKVYADFAKQDEYKAYLASEQSLTSDLEILLDLFRFCRKSEYFYDVMEDGFSNWVDDKSLVIGTVKKTFKTAANDPDVFKKYLPDDEIVEHFGMALLSYNMEEEDELLELVKPTLENWDHERLAIIDMILIKMALSEFLDFETIPTKVTINEYVEISKLYSTPKSKEFINGILDKLLKALTEEGKIVKEGRGLQE